MLHVIIVKGFEFLRGLFLSSENTNNGHPLNGFINNGINFTQSGTDNRIVPGGKFSIQHHPKNQDRDYEQASKSKPGIQQEQGDIDPNDIDNSCEKVR
ncbi:hypothetical protein D3C72_1896310 [compost metagenome]